MRCSSCAMCGGLPVKSQERCSPPLEQPEGMKIIVSSTLVCVLCECGGCLSIVASARVDSDLDLHSKHWRYSSRSARLQTTTLNSGSKSCNSTHQHELKALAVIIIELLDRRLKAHFKSFLPLVPPHIAHLLPSSSVQLIPSVQRCLAELLHHSLHAHTAERRAVKALSHAKVEKVHAHSSQHGLQRHLNRNKTLQIQTTEGQCNKQRQGNSMRSRLCWWSGVLQMSMRLWSHPCMIHRC
jgi:hypothetical protein